MLTRILVGTTRSGMNCLELRGPKNELQSSQHRRLRFRSNCWTLIFCGRQPPKSNSKNKLKVSEVQAKVQCSSYTLRKG